MIKPSVSLFGVSNVFAFEFFSLVATVDAIKVSHPLRQILLQ